MLIIFDTTLELLKLIETDKNTRNHVFIGYVTLERIPLIS